MSELKIGDRVRVVSEPQLVKTTKNKIISGMAGTVKRLGDTCAGVEFDDYMGGHNGNWGGKDGYCWHVLYERLEKIEEITLNTEEEIKEEIKADTLKQKIFTALREEIGVEIGEEFDVYENGVKRWTCKFEENGHLTRCHENGKFRVTFIWKYWIFHFDKYEFKKRLSFPTKEEPYFYVQMRLDNNGKAIYDGVDYVYWYGKDFDIAMLITGNYFKTEEEAEANKEKVIEKNE